MASPLLTFHMKRVIMSLHIEYPNPIVSFFVNMRHKRPPQLYVEAFLCDRENRCIITPTS